MPRLDATVPGANRIEHDKRRQPRDHDSAETSSAMDFERERHSLHQMDVQQVEDQRRASEHEQDSRRGVPPEHTKHQQHQRELGERICRARRVLAESKPFDDGFVRADQTEVAVAIHSAEHNERDRTAQRERKPRPGGAQPAHDDLGAERPAEHHEPEPRDDGIQNRVRREPPTSEQARSEQTGWIQ